MVSITRKVTLEKEKKYSKEVFVFDPTNKKNFQNKLQMRYDDYWIQKKPR